MSEQPQFPGLWTCPDYNVRISPRNDKPPFKFKCIGMELTNEGAEGFKAELMGAIHKRN